MFCKKVQVSMRFLLTAFLLVWIGLGSAIAGTVAVLPFDDLTVGGNALNLAFTEKVRDVLRDQGMEIVDPSSIDAFLVENGIRATGYLDALHTIKLCRETGCDSVIVGTVTESEEKNDPAVGFTYTVLDGATGKPLWGKTTALSLRECVGFLGLGQPTCAGDFRASVLKDSLFLGNLTAGKPLDERPSSYQIREFSLSSDVLQGGETIECLLRVDFLNEPASEIKILSGDLAIPFHPTETSGEYRALWPAPDSEGGYALSLKLVWQNPAVEEFLADFARYEVLNTAPPLKIDLKNVRTFKQLHALKDRLLIIPSVEDSRPLRYWSMAILNGDGTEVARTGQDGSLPPRLIWEGRDKSNHKLSDGVFEVAFDAWDYAGNRSSVRKKVIRQSQGLSINLVTVVEDGQPYLQLSPAEAQIVPVENWSIRAMNASGDVIVNQKGEALPVKLPLSTLEKGTHIVCDVDVVDILGNRMSLKGQSVKLEKKEDQRDEKSGFSSWAWVEEKK